MQPHKEVNWPRVARWSVAVAVYCIACDLAPETKNDIGEVIALILAIAAFWMMSRKARHEQERRIDAAELRESIGQ